MVGAARKDVDSKWMTTATQVGVGASKSQPTGLCGTVPRRPPPSANVPNDEDERFRFHPLESDAFLRRLFFAKWKL